MSKSYEKNIRKYENEKNPLLYFIKLFSSCSSFFSLTFFLAILMQNLLPQLEFLLTGKFIDFFTQENINIKEMETFLSRSFDDGIVPSGGQLQKIAIARVFIERHN